MPPNFAHLFTLILDQIQYYTLSTICPLSIRNVAHSRRASLISVSIFYFSLQISLTTHKLHLRTRQTKRNSLRRKRKTVDRKNKVAREIRGWLLIHQMASSLPYFNTVTNPISLKRNSHKSLQVKAQSFKDEGTCCKRIILLFIYMAINE